MSVWSERKNCHLKYLGLTPPSVSPFKAVICNFSVTAIMHFDIVCIYRHTILNNIEEIINQRDLYAPCISCCRQP